MVSDGKVQSTPIGNMLKASDNERAQLQAQQHAENNNSEKNLDTVIFRSISI